MYAVATLGEIFDRHRVISKCDDNIVSIVAREDEIAEPRRIFEVKFVDRPCYVVLVAADRVRVIAAFKDIGICSRTTFEEVAVPTAVERVFPIASRKRVYAPTAVERVSSPVTVERVCAPAAVEDIVAIASFQRIAVVVAVEDVVAIASFEDVVAVTTVEHIVAIASFEGVGAQVACQRVLERRASEVLDANKGVALGIVARGLARKQIDRNTETVGRRVLRARVGRGVYALASVQIVCPCATFQRIISIAAVEPVYTPKALERVRARQAYQQIPHATAREIISLASAERQLAQRRVARTVM